MTETIEAPVQALPGAKLLRATPTLLAFFDTVLQASVRDFCRRARDPEATPEAVLAALIEATEDPEARVWLAVTEGYRLLGFLLARRVVFSWGPPSVWVAAWYLYPKKRRPGVAAGMLAAVEAWAETQGARRLVGLSARHRPRAWRAFGARRMATLYGKELHHGRPVHV